MKEACKSTKQKVQIDSAHQFVNLKMYSFLNRLTVINWPQVFIKLFSKQLIGLIISAWTALLKHANYKN